MLTTTKYHERLCPSGQGRFFHAVLAQLAEHRSPSQANFSIVGNNVGLHIAEMLFLYKAASSLAIKPAVAGSNPANGATQRAVRTLPTTGRRRRTASQNRGFILRKEPRLMKREDVKNKIPGITEEQLNWLMQENGADINREKTAAEQPP